MASEGPFTIRRGDFEGKALLVYIPFRRGGRHFADSPSQALTLAKLLPSYGAEWAEAMAGLLAQIAPEGCTCVTCPPASSRRSARGWYFAEALSRSVARHLGLPFVQPLRWAKEGQEAAKGVRHQAGQGRKLGREVACDADLSGARVLLVDDGWTTGITAALCRSALLSGGAARVELRTLFATERTEHRPAGERAKIKARAALKGLRRKAGGGVTA
jgi:adenine/guanine phosphoribosyltransferase-like PRPP-binding protein